MEKTKKLLVGNPAHFELKGTISKDNLYFVIMNLPFECNYKCPKCYRESNISMEDLDLDVRKDAIRQAKDLGAKVSCIAGEGEPLFHKDITKELVRFNNSLDLITILYTNASLLDENTAQFLFENDVTLITSVDSLNPETYKELTGGGDLNIVKENLEKTREIYKRNVKRKGNIIETRLGLITIVTKQNKDGIEEIKEWCGDDIFYICNFPIQEGSAADNWDRLVGDNIQELIEISHKYTDTGYAGLSAPLKDGRCAALYNGITIDTNGDVLVCPASVNTRVGNIANSDLNTLWEKTRDYVKENGSPLCIARDGKDKTFKYHDGTVVQHL